MCLENPWNMAKVNDNILLLDEDLQVKVSIIVTVYNINLTIDNYTAFSVVWVGNLLFEYWNYNKPGTAQVGAISKAQK